MTRMAIPSEDARGQNVPDAEPKSEATCAVGLGRLEGWHPVDPWLSDSADATDRRIRRRAGVLGPMIAGVPLLADETGWGVRTVGWVLGGFGLGAAAGPGSCCGARLSATPALSPFSA